jgi:hypothetical protein
MASIFTMLITIIAAIFMAVIKQDQAIYSRARRWLSNQAKKWAGCG